MKRNYLDHQAQRFSIRKYSFGAVSVLIGCLLFLGAQNISADEVTSPLSTAETTVTQPAVSETEANQDSQAASVAAVQPENEPVRTAEAETSRQTAEVPAANTSTAVSPAPENPSAVSSKPVSEAKASAVTSEVKPAAQTVEKPAPVSSKSAVSTPARTSSKVSVKAVQQPVKKTTVASAVSLALQGNYTFKKQTPVKNQPKMSSTTQFFFNAGDKVYYDKVLNTDGHQWLSYISYSGTRRYAPIGVTSSVPAVPKPADTKPSLPASGTYHFTKQADVKNQPKMSSPTQFSFYKGDQVYYDKVLTADNHQWISYISYSGIRRYVVIASLTSPAKPQPKPAAPQAAGSINIQNKTAQQFDVLISKVSSNQTIKEVRVPVWSDQSGQDDIVWYKAAKAADGNYKVTVKISEHKNNTGKYHVHLYYLLDSGQQIGVGTAATTIETAKPSPSAPAKSTLPASGTYTFTAKTDVKNEARMSSPTQFFFNKGDKVFYDKVLETDGHQWLSYVSYSGIRRYAPIAVLSSKNSGQSSQPAPAKPNLPAQGTYTFTKEVSVKNAAKMSSPTQFTFRAGESINYDKVLTADGHQWLSYVSYSGIRRYVLFA
ncbi:SH3 domain-containing protein [Streptococcus devriesei]|uniref:SH3 domain-containing protein n=1 Tax=Streptococcus devriesei TaxID=231233 RepID=UPI0003FC437D|nr:SH3 domain-containing protein [Streptococcus devriesei]